MPLTLTIFSGLSATGKSTLSRRLAQELCQPLLCIDDLADCMPEGMDRDNTAFWDNAIRAMLFLAEAQLQLGVSVILDSLFMNLERFHARAIALKNNARFLPVYTFVSDEALWKERVLQRANGPVRAVPSWEQIQVQRQFFWPWEPGTALFLDGARPEDENYASLLSASKDAGRKFTPLPEVAFTPGKYHGV